MSFDIEKALQGITEVYRAGRAGPQPEAAKLLRAMVEAHQRNPEWQLPTPLLAMLVAARSVC